MQFEVQFGADELRHENKNKNHGKPLDILFKEAVGLTEKKDDSESEREIETNELKRKLRKLEKDVRRLKASSKDEKGKIPCVYPVGRSKNKTLSALFRNKPVKSEQPKQEDTALKELSVDIITFMNHLYREGYLKDANFLPQNKFDISCFDTFYSRDFVKFAAEKFGKDNQEIAKWVSGSNLKKVALFGCPSLAKKNVFAAKRLRKFFNIQEDTVCSKCVLKESCSFVNQGVWGGDTKHLNLADVMTIIVLYALELVPPQMVITDEIKASVSHLLDEIVKLSSTVSQGSDP